MPRPQPAPEVPRHKSLTRTHLDERCRTGRGLGVSLLRLWPGERLSPRWPLREPRSLLLQQQEDSQPVCKATPTSGNFEPQSCSEWR